MTKRRFGLKPLRWLSVLGAVALLGVGDAKAQWTFTGGQYPHISDNGTSWAFDVNVMSQDGDVYYLCLDRVFFPSTDPLDLSTPITDNQGGTYVITKIGDWCLYNYATDVAGAVTLPDTLADIGAYAFWGCDNLTEITIPAGVDHIGECAFAYCTVLEKVVFLGSAPPSVVGYDIYDNSDNVISYVYSVNGEPPDEWEWALDRGNSFAWPPAYWKFREIRCIDPPPVWFWDLSQSPSLMITNAVGWAFTVTILDQVNGKDMLSVGTCQGGPSVPSPLDFTGAIEGGALIVNYESAGFLVPGGLLSSAPGLASSLIFATTATNISLFAFYAADLTGTLVLPDSLVSIGESAFAYNTNLGKVIIPASVQDIERFAFYNPGAGLEVEFLGGYPSGVVGDLYEWNREGPCDATTYIHVEYLQSWLDSGEVGWDEMTGSGGWRGCTLICLDYVPPPITYSWFWDSANGGMITNAVGWKFQVAEENLALAVTNCIKVPGPSGNSNVYPLDFSGNIEGGRSIIHLGGPTATNLAEGMLFMTTINSFTYVGALTLPASLKNICYGPFYMCYNMPSINFNGCSVTNIGDYAFNACYSLSAVNLPSSVKTLGSYAFGYNRSLASLTLNNGLEEIGFHAFAGCTNLVGTLSIPASVKLIWNSAFENCSKITTLSFGSASALTVLGNEAFANCTSLTGALVLPSGLEMINRGVFSNSTLSSITVPASVFSIWPYAFYTQSPSLTSVTFEGYYPWMSVGTPFYYTGGNVTTYVHHAYAHTAANIVGHTWASKLDNGSPALDDSGDARWMGRPIVCLNHMPEGWHRVTLDPGVSYALLVGGHDETVDAEEGQPMPTVKPPQMKSGTSVFIGYTNSLGRLYYDGSGNSPRLCDAAIGDTLYAVWNDFVNQGTIVYIATPGSFADGSELQIVEASISSLQDYYIFPSEDPTRDGYDFKGWTRVKDTLPLVIEGMDFVDFDYILYAYWEPKTPSYEIPVFINSIDVTPEGNVTLQWGNKQVKDVFGSPASYYKVLVSTNLVNWGDAPAIETRDIGGTDDSVNMANATLPPSTKRFFKVNAVK